MQRGSVLGRLQGIHRRALLSLAALCAACAPIGRAVTYQSFRAQFAPCPDAVSAGAVIHPGPGPRYIEARRPGALAQVLYFHGVGKGACQRSNLIAKLGSMGCDVILGEYPGFDGAGDANEAAILQSALELRDKMAAEHPDLPLVIYGESLGSAVATY